MRVKHEAHMTAAAVELPPRSRHCCNITAASRNAELKTLVYVWPLCKCSRKVVPREDKMVRSTKKMSIYIARINTGSWGKKTDTFLMFEQ